jgi:hypothetical protein
VILANVTVHPSSHDGGELRETVRAWVKEKHLELDIGMDIKTFGASSSSSQNPELIQVYLEAVANALDTRVTDDGIR